jgi:hypothetical protein
MMSGYAAESQIWLVEYAGRALQAGLTEAAWRDVARNMQIYFERPAVTDFSGSSSGSGLTQDQIQTAIRNALGGASTGAAAYYSPPTWTGPSRSSGALTLPHGPATVPNPSLHIPGVASMPTLTQSPMSGLIAIPVLGQTYYFNWSTSTLSSFVGGTTALETIRLVIRSILLCGVLAWCGMMVWKTLRQL